MLWSLPGKVEKDRKHPGKQEVLTEVAEGEEVLLPL
jgi:hypothetical protein